MGRPRHVALACFVIVVVAGVVAFIPALTGGWIYDDHPLIANNVYVHSAADWPHWFVTDFWNIDSEVVHFGKRILYWRPGVSASYALDWKLGGGSPLMFHITNYLLQGATSGLVFVVLRRWIGVLWPAFFAALIFVVHPTKAESVAWIAGRTDIMCLLAVLVASNGIARRLAGRHGGIAMEAAGTIVAYLCKEQAIVLPCFAAVEVWVALGRPAFDRSVIVKMLRGALPQAVLAIAYLAIRTIVLPIGPAGGGAQVPLVTHALAVLETLGRFFALAFAPHDLSIQQGLVHEIHRELLQSPMFIAIGAVTTAALVALAWWTRRRAPLVAVGIAFYFATLFPTSNVKYTSMSTLISERFLYLPLLGLVVAFAAALIYAEKRWGHRVYGIATLIAIALTLQSVSRSSDYVDETTFWARELELHPDSQEARAQAFEHDSQEKRFYDALAVLQHSEPYDAPVHDQMSFATDVTGVLSRLVPDHDAAKLVQIDQFIANVLDHKPATLNLMSVSYMLDTSRLGDTSDFIKGKPRLQLVRADVQSRLGHDATAVELATDALISCTSCFTLIDQYALALARAGQYDEALAALDSVQHASPEALATSRDRIVAAKELSVVGQQAKGPPALQARASELAKLELWGRAYDVLAPYEADIAKVPKFAAGFAELAFRAGEPAIARRVLLVSKPPAESDALIAEWTAKMGWTHR